MPLLVLRAAVVALVLAGAGAHARGELVALPRGSRPASDGSHRSGRSFRDTVDFYSRLLRRDGTVHEAFGPYRRRGILVARFVSSGRATWRAIHVWSRGGQTFIFVVPASPPGP